MPNPTPILLSPMQTTNAVKSFPNGPSSEGLFQGMAYDDPASRQGLTSGVLDSASTPIWAGVGITARVPKGEANGGTVRALGGRLTLATTLANLSGFSLANQAHHGLTSPGLPVPLFLPNMTVHFSRFGSRQRVALAVDPAIVAALSDAYDGMPVSWDFVNQWITTYTVGAGALPVKILDVNVGNSIVVNVDPNTGAVTYNYNGNAVVVQL